jgi:predicted RNase H-like HicB family nuclease
MKDEASTIDRPVVVQFAVNLKALVYAEPEAGGYSAEVPALPGCYTQGETLEEVQANLIEAAEGWLGSVHDEAMSRHARRDGIATPAQ